MDIGRKEHILFSNSTSNKLINRLISVFPEYREIVSEKTLLEVYGLLWGKKNNIKMSSENSIKGLYSIDSSLEGFTKITDDFLKIDFSLLLRALPGYIACPDRLESSLEVCEDDVIEMTSLIFLVKKWLSQENVLDNFLKNKAFTSLKNRMRVNGFIKNLSDENLLEIIESIATYNLDWNSMMNIPINRINTEAYKAAYLFNNELLESKDKQFEYAAKIYEHKLSNEYILEYYYKTKFSSNEVQKAKEIMYEIKESVLKSCPLDIASALEISKKTLTYSYNSKGEFEKGTSGSAIEPNDIMLSISLAYRFFLGSISLNKNSDNQYLVFSPSSYFIRKWANDPVVRDLNPNITFVVNEWKKILFETHFSNEDYCGSLRTDFNFKTYEEMRLESPLSREYESALIFPNLDLDSSKSKISKTLLEDFPGIKRAYILSAEGDFKNFIRTNNHVSDALLLPKGINNSKSPKQKVFWMYNSQEKQEKIIFNLGKLVNHDSIQRLLFIDEGGISIAYDEVIGNSKESLRRIYNSAMPKKNSSAETREKPRYIDFSKEIRIWYWLQPSKKKKGHYRLDAYICDEAREGKSKELLPRGKRIEDSKKQKNGLLQLEVENWLKEEYPYSYISRKKSGENENKQALRDIISSHYRRSLKNESISIKTLWYIYPEIENLISSSEKMLLKEMATGAIGHFDLANTTAEEYIDAISNNFMGSQMARLNVLSTAISYAVKQGHCQNNVIDETLSDISSINKGRLDVRNALTKKSLTTSELKGLYEIICSRITNEGKPEYIGVLIKLLTGLESNIICALKVEDFVRVEDYGFYKFMIWKQLTNDGSEERDMQKVEDYRCIPCSQVLSNYVMCQVDSLKEKFPDSFLKMSIISATSAEETQKPVSPTMLDRICNSLIKEIGIEDNVISIPDFNKGVKETNLSRYGGDIYRENFRYWANKRGKLSLDEISYLLGNKQSTTFGKFYCDFINDKAQLALYVKLLRLDSMLLSGTRRYQKNIIPKMGDRQIIFEAEGDLPLSIKIIAKNIEVGKCKIEMANSYGIAIQAGKINGGEEE
ncbi:MAG: hypothetical protein PHT84_02665 [Candidatus Pacebacteria bacterium]|nr:hypothetical protein [Candidatus Paceibacterota bacterium]